MLRQFSVGMFEKKLLLRLVLYEYAERERERWEEERLGVRGSKTTAEA